MKATLDILTEARELISDFDSWHQGDYAVEDTGIGCGPDSTHAVAWCAAGAIIKVAGGTLGVPSLDPVQKAYRLVERAAIERYHVGSLPNLNDGAAADDEAQAHGQVLKAYDDAILAHKIALGVS